MTFSDYDIQIPPGKITGQVYTQCPKCSHDRKKKLNKCLSVNIDQGLWHCHHCAWTGSLTKKKYILPKWENKTELPEKIIDWFLQRNIKQETLILMKITASTEWMPQVEANRNAICFNYFRDEELVNIKYRDAEKNFKMHTGSELIFYNINAIIGKKECYIVEGEIDCLTMIQEGYPDTISVPNGAAKSNNNLQYLDNCYQYFEQIEKVYLLTDNDEPGEALAQELARRIGVEKCYRIRLKDYKDVNEQFCKTGRLELPEATPVPIEGIFSLDHHWEGLLNILKNGFPKGYKPRGGIGEHIQIHPGYTTIITGIPGHGKSEWLDQMILRLCIDYNLRVAYFSPENRPTEMHLIKLIEKILGKSLWKTNEVELNKAKAFLEDRIFWIYPPSGYDLDAVLIKVRQAVLRYGINFFVLDPWNRIEHQYEGSETKYISEALDKIANFNIQNLTHAFIVAHPIKMKQDQQTGRYETPGLYDISGSANFYNKADIGITVYKQNTGEDNYYRNTVYVQKVKFKYWGKTGQVDYTWNPENGRYDERGVDYSYWLQNTSPPLIPSYKVYQSEGRKEDNEVPF